LPLNLWRATTQQCTPKAERANGSTDAVLRRAAWDEVDWKLDSYEFWRPWGIDLDCWDTKSGHRNTEKKL